MVDMLIAFYFVLLPYGKTWIHVLQPWSSNSHADDTDSPYSLLPFVPIVYYFRQIFKTASYVLTELMQLSPSWLTNTCAYM